MARQEGTSYIDFGRSRKAMSLNGTVVSQSGLGNPAGVGTSTFLNYVMPGNALNVQGKGVRMRVWASTANNANSKTVNLRFGATTVATSTTTTALEFLYCEAIITRVTATTQRAIGTGFRGVDGGTITTVLSGKSPTETLTQDVGVSLQTTATPATDITIEAIIFEVFTEGSPE